jgi:hypothetical protein
VDVAKSQHQVGAAGRRQLQLLRRLEGRQPHAVVQLRLRLQLLLQTLGTAAAIVHGRLRVGAGEDQQALLAQVGRQDLGVPATARIDLDHCGGGPDAEEEQRLVGVAPAVARGIGRRALRSGDGRLQPRLG